ncbi:helix-turn-helix domain-containing protein [Mycobacterium sp. 21AC1]|uniref:helix-turn-helix domain-containing protein n=1 Tax=[Mycobacterium] appelbergii TaxID=2939269 RepID=UPI002938F3C1|nr:helix-turn-helix domain-containing protein [Mycobacterium sp. 21AC1]MDV3125420.1 helix-turn-helix domain-containing protein [Mycobacterium sp. 21AC1]
MLNLTARREDTRLRWRWLLQALGNLDDDLAAEYLVQIDRGARFYDSVPDEEDLLDAARLAFRYLLATLLERPMSAELAEFPAAVGALRATQGIALENLTAAVRTDFLVAWSALLKLAGDDDMTVLALHVDVLWKAVDDFAIQVQRGYLDQRLSMARASTLEQQHSLSELFSGEPGPTTVRRAAQILGLDEAASYWVIGVCGEEAGRTVTRRLLAKHLTALDYVNRGVALILVAADGRWPDDEAVMADLLPELQGAVAPRAVLLPEVHRAATTVRMLVDLDVEATTLRRSWAQLSITQLSEVIEDLRGYVLGPLHDVHDCELIVETIQEFADSGSVADTASALYCHRNTVMNRIRRFEEATGISLRSPRALAMVQLCLLPA